MTHGAGQVLGQYRLGISSHGYGICHRQYVPWSHMNGSLTTPTIVAIYVPCTRYMVIIDVWLAVVAGSKVLVGAKPSEYMI